MVLRIHVVREGGHGYYVDDLVPGRAEGSPVAGEEPGQWWGGGAEALGQSDRVDASAFAELLAGRDPVSGEPLRARRVAHGVAGYDLTFGAPKSVSLLHLLAPREIAQEAGAAHRVAVDDALGYLQRVAVGVRRSRSGELVLLPATGMVAAVFLHRTSRALDPHLHTHAVAANVAQGLDGQWSAVDSRRVFVHARAAQAVYHARLRLEIGIRMGGAFEVGASGLGDVTGVDRALRRLFSQRMVAMDEFRGNRATGRSWRAAYFATRPAKDRECTVDSLRSEWRDRAASFGFDLGELTAVVGRRRSVDTVGAVDRERMAAALGALARRGRSLSRRDLVAETGAASVQGAPASGIESVVDRVIQHGIAASRAGDGGAPRTSVWSGREPRWDAGPLAEGWEEAMASPVGSLDGPSPTAVDRPRSVRRHRMVSDLDPGRIAEPSSVLAPDLGRP